MTIWSSTQNPHILRTMIAAMTGLGQDQVRAIAPEVGGGFGAKINIYGEEYVAAVVSKRLGLPVKWIEDRSEAFVATTHGRDIIGYVDIAAKRDGKVLGLKMRLIADIGAYNMLLTAAIPTLTMLMANGTYDIPAIRTTLTEVFTNKTPTDAYRGAGRPEATYFVERAMDMLARELKMDPAERAPEELHRAGQVSVRDADGRGLRLRGLRQGARPRAEGRRTGRRSWPSATPRARKGGSSASGSRCTSRCAASARRRRCRPAAGNTRRSPSSATAGISATTGASPHGQGNETTFAQMLADQFSVPIEHITIHHGDTGVVKQGIGTFGSRSQAVGGTALHLAGGKVKAKMAKFAAALLEAHEDDIVFENGTIGVKGAPASAKAFAEVAGYAYVPVPLPPGLEPGLSDEAFFEPANNTYPFGCHISMLEIDRETGEPTLLKLIAVDDAGNLINPLIVEGQIHGGLAQGIGQAMIEEAVYNDDGQLLTGSFMDYAMPRATDFPRFELHSTVTPTPVQPARRQGRGRSRHARLDAVHRERGGRRAERVRREAHRHDAAAREAVAASSTEASHDSDDIRVRTRDARSTTRWRSCRHANGSGKLIAGGHSLRAADEAAPQRAATLLIDISRIPDLVGHQRARRATIVIGAGHRAPRRRDARPAAREVPDGRGGRGRAIGDPQVRNRGTHRRQRRARRPVGRLCRP